MSVNPRRALASGEGPGSLAARRSPAPWLRLAALLGLGLGLANLATACDGGSCEEDIRAQVLDARATIEIGDQQLNAEVATTEVERERGWKHRRCALEGLALIAPEDGELSLWGCGLREAVDVHWIRDGQVLGTHGPLEPCAEPCGACPIVEAGAPVDAAIEVPHGALEVRAGDTVTGLAQWLPGAP